MMSKKSPQLRFKGFTDAWEQRKLNEVSDIYDGTHQTPKYQDDGVMFLSVENIKTLTSNKFISREAFEDEFKIRPQRGDVLMTRIGDIGTANVVETDEDLAYYVSLALFKSEELNPYFLQASIYSPFVQDQIWKRTLHIAFPKKINKNEIGQVPINVPTLEEQTKIGSFFKQLDDTITLHQRKLDLLKEQKKGYLQKMFPKNGSKIPELRFQGFSGDWAERKLKDISFFIDGNYGAKYPKDSEFMDSGIPFFTSAVIGKNGIFNRANVKYISNDKNNELTKAQSYGGDLVLTNRGASMGAISEIPLDFDQVNIGPQLTRITADKNNNNLFLLALLKTPYYSRKLISMNAGSAMNFVGLDTLGKFSLLAPNLREQQKIGAFFKQLDDTIALHQRKLDLLKEQKKGFLQKMFI